MLTADRDLQICTAALQAVRHGWRVFPMRQKQPYFPRWKELATLDPSTVQLWFGELYPGAGLGAIPPARIVRLDIDIKGDGFSTIQVWRRSGRLISPTLTSRTPSGGEHRYLISDTELPGVRLADGVEMKVGAVILPPTRGYAWQGYGEERPAAMPDWLQRLAVEAAERAKAERARAGFALGKTTISELAWRIEAATGEEPLEKSDGFLSFPCPAHQSRHRRSAWAVETPRGVRIGCFAECPADLIVEALA